MTNGSVERSKPKGHIQLNQNKFMTQSSRKDTLF
eukprot:CAMPEP_0169424578 /NCGR_PEP_ID=MMETSP1017-20121227/68116_1 /TAXON_ID=342587 /ORGANISM="Karlodinium micrum, Strain CCMP2283" /LENGTH=33 /DNA_ID= /DNA_START= /DNA_END= /DNA_ORIENTATION=